MAVEVRELAPPANIRGLIENTHERHTEPTAGRPSGQFLCRLDHSDREGSDEWAGGAPSFLGQRVEGAAVAHESLGVEVRPAVSVYPCSRRTSTASSSVGRVSPE